MVVGGAAPVEATLTGLPSDAASTLALSLDGARVSRASSGTVSLTTFDAALGAAVVGSFHALFAGPPGSVDGDFTTFVRDVDPAPLGCATRE